ncbi:hypothetical protein [Nocardia sp. 348MFTsu5.1]|uniref:hypothetical protein n=1 Tax=Nocardia sp. 348MFTsu5.1 TaxID=1172185 RepID=UPI0003798D9A|nr:hypothetical protein [Nocardia sp. 348MFTsu5.1]
MTDRTVSVLKAGQRLASTVCETQVIVIKTSGQLSLECGGYPMSDDLAAPADGAPVDGLDGGTLIGKRYTLPDSDAVEVMATRGGAGSLSIGGVLLTLKESKPLPASD